ncbi:MAG TPA: nitroreductase family protein [Desulfobulbus sp.]|nr:nitroreductase family protein [Desulfobulbus sp.]
MEEPVFNAILGRRSIREFTDQPVTTAQLHKIVTAGIWAPSGLNNQPWRFVLIRDKDTAGRLAEQTRYGRIVESAPALIGVFLDTEAMYDPVKDHQAAGACIQNMLLCITEMGLGAVWLGQILQNKHRVNEILGLDPRYDLMALLAVGHPAHRNQRSRRRPLADFILNDIGGEKT